MESVALSTLIAGSDGMSPNSSKASWAPCGLAEMTMVVMPSCCAMPSLVPYSFTSRVATDRSATSSDPGRQICAMQSTSAQFNWLSPSLSASSKHRLSLGRVSLQRQPSPQLSALAALNSVALRSGSHTSQALSGLSALAEYVLPSMQQLPASQL